MGKMIYLDNAATTKTAPEVVEAMLPYFTEMYGNPSSIYDFASKSKEGVSKARGQIADALGAKKEEIYFTAGGSESDNWALKATFEAYKSKGNHIITTKIEHHAILHTCEYLEKERGAKITYLDVDENGIVKLDELEKAITPETILISVMFANNEIGSIQPIKEIGAIAKEHGILFHTDAVQAFGQVPINVDELGIDMLSSSGHKLNGPKGIGFIYINEKAKVKPIIFGGGQQKDMRSGTENVPGIAGLALASKMIYQDLELKTEHMRELKTHFIDCISQIGNVKVHGLTDEGSAPHIVSAGFAGVRSEVLLHTLEDRGICVSAGSACASNHPAISGVLQAIGTPREYLDSTLRFSLSEFTTKEEIDYTLETLYNCIPMLRKYTRR